MKSAAFLRRARKTDVDWGKWESGRPMPKSALKLRKPYPVSGKWTWRLVRFSVDGDRYTVLLKHRKGRQDFMAMLVRETEGEPGSVLCRIEHHGSHPGWHVHYQAHAPFVSGVVRMPGERRRDCGVDSAFEANVVVEFNAWAMTLAERLFNLREDQDKGLL